MTPSEKEAEELVDSKARVGDVFILSARRAVIEAITSALASRDAKIKELEPKKKEPIDLGVNSTCNHCEKRLCTCPERNADGGWGDKDTLISILQARVKELEGKLKDSDAAIKVLCSYNQTEVARLTAENQRLIAVLSEIEVETRPNGSMADQAVNTVAYAALSGGEKKG